MQVLMSLGFGLIVGIAYGLVGIKSPAPPIVALFGLLGMVLGERGVAQLRHRIATPTAASSGTVASGGSDRSGTP